MYLKNFIYTTLYFCSLCISLYAQQVTLKFEPNILKSELSQETIASLYEDQQGFIWIGTDSGLNRYDGTSLKIYLHDNRDANSLSMNEITSTFQDHLGYLWVGTLSGLNRINLKTNVITRYYAPSISGNEIKTIKTDAQNNLWVATDKGLSVYNHSTNTFYNYNLNLNLKINDFLFIKKNYLWLGTENGLKAINLDTQHTSFIIEQPHPLNQLRVVSFSQDHKQQIWVGTNNGLYVLKNDKIIRKKLFNSQLNAEENNINTIFQDRSNNIWIGTNKGLFLTDTSAKSYTSFYHKESDLNSISNDYILSISQDASGMLWFGTFTGLNKLNLGQKVFNYFSLYPDYVKEPLVELIWSIHKDHFNNLWIGTGDGLYIFNEDKKRVKKMHSESNGFFYSLHRDQYNNMWALGREGVFYYPNNKISSIWDEQSKLELKRLQHPILDALNFFCSIEELKSRNEVWLGTLDFGLIKIDNLDPSLTHFNVTHFTTENSELRNNHIGCINAINNNEIWIGTRNGLHKLQLSDNTFEHYKLSEDQLSETYISSVAFENDSIMWLGTFNNGLLRFNNTTQQYSHLSLSHGLPNVHVYESILAEDNQVLWLTTLNGLSRIDTKTYTVKNYYKNDGLQENEFTQGASFKDEKGKIYVGGANGINSFYSKNIRTAQIPPKIALTELKIFNKPILPNKTNKSLGISNDDHIIMKEDIQFTNHLSLSYNHYVISFTASVMHGKNPEKNQIAYKLAGFDKDWTLTNAMNNKFTYTNLNPGEYVLHIKGLNSDGIWSDNIEKLTITIAPPYWKTNWFYGVMAFSIAAIVYIILLFWQRQIRMRERRKFLKLENEQKTAMLKEIHHRVKNNLHVVNSLLRIQASKIKEADSFELEDIEAMFRKAQNRVLSMAVLHEKMYQSNTYGVINAESHFKPLIQDLIHTYGIDKSIELDVQICPVDFNMETLVPLSLIINELISNSLKHAFNNIDECLITIHLNKIETHKSYQLIIGDNGTFNTTNNHKKSGIGTKLIHSFVRQLKGTITRLDRPGTFYEITFKGS